MSTKIMTRNSVLSLVFLLLTIALVLGVRSVTRADDEFALRLTANGSDIVKAETIVIDPEKQLIIDLQISDVNEDLTLKKLSMIVTFAGQDILNRSESLGDFHMSAGDIYTQEIVINTGDILKVGDRPLITGVYRSEFRLEYAAAGQERAWVQWKNLKILGNPLSTPIGVAGVLAGLGTVTAFLFLFRSLAAPNLPAGTTLPARSLVKATPRLYELASERLEPATRGRVIGSIVDAVKRRIVRDKCPICETRLKHGYCFACKKSAKEIRHEYTNMLETLCLQGGQLLADAPVTTVDELCSRLHISGKLGTDVIDSLRHAKLVKVKGVARKLAGKAVTAGIGTGLSTVIWVTVGGLTVLGAPALVGILIASIVIPFTIIKSLQVKARHAVSKSAR